MSKEKLVEKTLCLVTGGAGMLGNSIVEQLLDKGYSVRIFDIKEVNNLPVETIIGDIRNFEQVTEACEGVNIIFHTAAQVWDPSVKDAVYEEINIEGTKNMIKAAMQNNVEKLIFTSTFDVVMKEPLEPIINGDESLPYPDPLPENPYARTKIVSEKEVLNVDQNKLLTCSLRPVGLYGPRDKYHLPNFINIAKNKIKLKVGKGEAVFPHLYCENAAHAHILAAEKLGDGANIEGEAFIITDYEEENIFKFMEPFLRELGLKPPKRHIPFKLAHFLASIAEKINPNGVFTKFSVCQCCKDLIFSSEKARKKLGYEPIVSKEEAFERTVNWLKSQEF